MKKLATIGALVLGLTAFGKTALAASTTTNMAVTANVAHSCSIQAGTLAFGTYDPIVNHATNPLDGTSTLTVACTKGTPANIQLDVGANASGATRRLSDGAGAFINYEIYNDSSRSTVWNATNVVNYTAPSRAPSTFTAYGRIPAAQDVPMGSYTDTVVATINY